MDLIFHKVPSLDIANSDIYKIYKILEARVSKVYETTDGCFFYCIPTNNVLNGLKKGITQEKILSLIKIYNLTTEKPI